MAPSSGVGTATSRAYCGSESPLTESTVHGPSVRATLTSDGEAVVPTSFAALTKASAADSCGLPVSCSSPAIDDET